MDALSELYMSYDLSSLDKITLVIPTYNRVYYLSRCLWYHAHFPFGQIIVADSSEEVKRDVNKRNCTKIASKFNRNIVYLEYIAENKQDGSEIAQKWIDAVNHVTTEYVQICTDKEFILPGVSAMGIKYLDENPGYVCAFGNRLEFIKSILSKKFVAPFCIQTYDDLRAIERLNRMNISRSIPENNFQIYHTDVKKLLNLNQKDHDLNDIRYGEIATELQPIVYGKIKQFDVPGRVRDMLASRTGFFQKVNKKESSSIRYSSLLDYPSHRKEQLQNQLIQCLLKIKPESDSSDAVEINEITKKIIRWWMEIRLDKFTTRCRYFIVKQLPDSMRKILAYLEKIRFTKSPNKKIVKKELKLIKMIILNTQKSLLSDETIEYVSRDDN